MVRAIRGGDDRGVTRIPRGELRDVSHADAVVVAAGEERGTSWGTKRGGVELVVAQTALRHAIQGWCQNRTAEGTGRREAGIIGHNQQHIRGVFWRGDGFWEVWRGFAGLASNDATELRLRDRKYRRTA